MRFSLCKLQETQDEFIKRINKAARSEEENVQSSSDDRWLFGSQSRDLGSIHSDIWEGTSLEVAECSSMIVYPTIGWWRERNHLNKYNNKARYSLIVSLSTPDEEIDIYTPIVAQIGVPVPVSSN